MPEEQHCEICVFISTNLNQCTNLIDKLSLHTIHTGDFNVIFNKDDLRPNELCISIRFRLDHTLDHDQNAV